MDAQYCEQAITLKTPIIECYRDVSQTTTVVFEVRFHELNPVPNLSAPQCQLIARHRAVIRLPPKSTEEAIVRIWFSVKAAMSNDKK